MTLRVYLAGPMGSVSYQGANGWREYAKNWLEPLGIRCHSPMRDSEELSGMNRMELTGTSPLTQDRGIVVRDRSDVMRADALLVNLVGATDVSIGTMIELGWATAHNKPIVIAMGHRDLYMTPAEAAWLAALIDGEGYVGIQQHLPEKEPKRGLVNPTYQPRLAIQMKCKEVLDRAAGLAGDGEVKLTTEGYYRWSLDSGRVIPILRNVYPYLIEKRPMAALVLEMLDIQATGLQGRKKGTGRVEKEAEVFARFRRAIERQPVSFTEPDISDMHDHPFVRESGIVVPTLDEAIETLISILDP